MHDNNMKGMLWYIMGMRGMLWVGVGQNKKKHKTTGKRRGKHALYNACRIISRPITDHGCPAQVHPGISRYAACIYDSGREYVRGVRGVYVGQNMTTHTTNKKQLENTGKIRKLVHVSLYIPLTSPDMPRIPHTRLSYTPSGMRRAWMRDVRDMLSICSRYVRYMRAV